MTAWTPERLKKFKRTMAAKRKAKLKTKRSGVIPFSAIPDAPKFKPKAAKVSSYEEKYTAKQVAALIRELMK